MKTPDLMPILSAGAHKSPAEGACIMEYASLLAGEEWTDNPKCTHPALAAAARYANDWLGDEARQTLLPLLPRLMGTTSDDWKVSLRLAVFAARYVLHLVPAEHRSVCERAIDAIEAAVYGTGTRGIASAAALGAAEAAIATRAAVVPFDQASYAATHAAYAAAEAARGYVKNAVIHAVKAVINAAPAHMRGAAAVEADPVAFLAALIDEYDRITGRGQVDPLTESDLKVLQEATK